MTIPIDPHTPSTWLRTEGPDSDVVISSRVRFARNLQNYPFASKNSRENREKLLDEIFSVIQEYPPGANWITSRLEELSSIEKNLLAERNLISKQLLTEPAGGTAFIPEETLGVMINEEDHLRIQAITAGNDLDLALAQATDLERFFDTRFEFAYDEKWGYLTSCPTNLGTGFRGSILLHLPGLVITEKLNRVLNAISNLGLTVRGFYGEGSETRGFYFQLSNQITLGRSTEDFLASLKRVGEKIISHERAAREQLLKKRDLGLKDKIGRAFGILKYAHQIESEEAIELLSMCRLGADRKLLPELKIKKLDGFLQLLQPAHLQQSVGTELTSEERESYRARLVEKEFSTTPS